MRYSRLMYVMAHYSGRHYGEPITWQTASLGAKLAAIAVLALLGSVGCLLLIPIMAILGINPG